MNKLKHNKGVIISVVLIAIVLVVILLGFNISEQEKDKFLLPDNEIYKAPLGENLVILENGQSSLSEGKNLPADLDLTEILPRLPLTSELLNISDVNQPGLRVLTLEYNVVREDGDVKELVLDTYIKSNWDSVVEDREGTIIALKDNYEVRVQISQIEKLKSIVIVEVRINEVEAEPIEVVQE